MVKSTRSLIGAERDRAEGRTAFWESVHGLTNGNVGFAFSIDAYCFLHCRLEHPIRFSKIHIFVTTAAGNVVGEVWTADATNLTKVGSSGVVAAAGASAIQALDMGSFLAYDPGKDIYIGLGISSATLRILTGNQLAAQSPAMQLLPFGPVGRFRQKTITPPSPSQVAISSLAAVVSQPAPWVCIIDGV